MRFNFPLAGEINRLQSEIERAFGPQGGSALTRGRVFPPINVWEDDDNVYVESEIPGMEFEDIEVFVNDENQLTLQGERKQPDGTVETRHRTERSFGRFSRVIQLPVGVEGETTSAAYKAGVLTVTMPKKEEAKPRRIAVSNG